MNRPKLSQRIANSKLLFVYPLLLAAVPALHMAAENSHDIDSRSTTIAVLGCVGLAAIIFAGLYCFLRNGQKVATGTMWLLLLFFTFGRVFDLLWESFDWGQIRALLYPLYAVYGLLAIVGLAWLRRTKVSLQRFTSFAALFAAIIFGISARNFVHEYKHFRKDQRRIEAHRAEQAKEAAETKKNSDRKPNAGNDSEANAENSGVVQASFETAVSPVARVSTAVSADELPDIYYIILDGYAREDILQEFFDYDNSGYLNSLRDRGFYVADAACCNYPMTILSLPSALNMRFLDAEFAKHGRWNTKYGPMIDLTSNNRVAAELKERGYRIVHFATNWCATQESGYADVTYTLKPDFMQREFIGVFLRTTALRPLAPQAADAHELMFDKLREVPDDPAPTFAFAHFILPHHPYVFDSEGNRRTDMSPELDFDREEGEANPWHDKASYLAQLEYASLRIREVCDEIIAKSDRPPIIILQSDHGSASQRKPGIAARTQPDLVRERTAILNAYYVPQDWQDELYPEITPVNSFRFVFRHLFGEGYDPLEDRLYFSWYAWPFNAKEITQQIRGAGTPASAEEE